MTMPPHYRRKADTEVRRLTGAAILVDPEGNHFGINQVGVRIWDLLDEGRSLDGLVEVLLGEFDVTEVRCRGEAEHFLGELLERGLVERVGR